MAIVGHFPTMAYDWDEAYVKALFADRVLAPIEGVWEFSDGGATVAIVMATSSTFDIYLLDSPYLNVQPGTLIGRAVSSPKRNYYDGEIQTKKLGGKLKKSAQTVTFTVNDEGTLTVKPYKTGKTVSLNRWISSLFKVRVVDNNRRPTDLDGAKRVYPVYLSDNYPICL